MARVLILGTFGRNRSLCVVSSPIQGLVVLILDVQAIPVASTYLSLEPELAKLGGQLLMDVLRLAKSDSVRKLGGSLHGLITFAF